MKRLSLMFGRKWSQARALAWLLSGCLAAGIASAQNDETAPPAPPAETDVPARTESAPAQDAPRPEATESSPETAEEPAESSEATDTETAAEAADESAAAEESGDAADEAAESEDDSEADSPADEEEDTADEEEAADLVNWVEFGFGGTFTRGSRAEFQRQHQLPEVFGGVTSLHYEKTFGEDETGLFKADIRGLFNNDDYQVRLELSDESKGHVRVGYREFRTWYNGAGGWFPAGAAWHDPFDYQEFVDRGEAWVELGLTLPDLPVVEFSYHHWFRNGEKNSTIWGASTVPGLPAGSNTRHIAPTWLGLDEQRDLFALDVKHTLGSVTFGVGGTYEHAEFDNSRNVLDYPDQPNAAATTQREQSDEDLFSAHAFAETRLSEKILLTLGYAYTDLDTDLSGYRVYGTAYDPDLGQRLPSAATFGSLGGGADQSQHTGNLNLMMTLGENFYLVPSLRFESEDLSGSSLYTSPADALGMVYNADNDRGYLEVAENLDLRYAGLKNWVFYARGNWVQGSGDLEENWDNLISGANVVRRKTDDTHSWQKYSVGAHWYACSRVSVSFQYYHKIRNNQYDHAEDSSSNQAPGLIRYPAYLRAEDFVTDDVNVRLSVRPRSNLQLVLRYDYQTTTLTSQVDRWSSLDASDMNSQIYGASLSWTPWHRIYLLGSVSYVLDSVDTLAAESVAVMADAHNNYWTATGGVGYALDQKTDVNVQYIYYRADNYDPARAAVSVPYNAGFEQQGVTVGLTRQLNPRTRLGLQYGFFTYDDETSGHHLDYDAHLVYGTLQYRF
jgi:opacity protein-like surface antigen